MSKQKTNFADTVENILTGALGSAIDVIIKDYAQKWDKVNCAIVTGDEIQQHIMQNKHYLIKAVFQGESLESSSMHIIQKLDELGKLYFLRKMSDEILKRKLINDVSKQLKDNGNDTIGLEEINAVYDKTLSAFTLELFNTDSSENTMSSIEIGKSFTTKLVNSVVDEVDDGLFTFESCDSIG